MASPGGSTPPPAVTPPPETPITHPNLSLVSFSGNDPNQDATSFWNSVENKILFSLGTRPTAPAAQTSYDKRQQSLFGSLLTDTALEWFESEVTDTTDWNTLKDEFIKRFTDGRDQFRFRLEVENTFRQEGELIKNYLHRIKSGVDKGWPEKIPTSIEGDDNIRKEKEIQQRQRSQKYIDFAIRGLRPQGLKRKAHEKLIENPSITWTQFVDHLVVKDLTFSVTTESSGATGVDKLKTLESKINDLTSLFKSNEVNAIDTSRPRDPNIKGRPNSTRFCDYCRSNGHSISRCTKKQIDDSVNKLRKELVEPRRPNITFSNDYRKNNRGNTRFNGPRNQGYQPRGGYSIYNPRFNKPNYQQQNTSFSSYGNRFTQPYEQTFPQQNTYRNNEPNLEQQSPSPQQQQQPQQSASFYTPSRNNNLQQRQSKPNNIQQQPNQISFVEGDDDYVNAITDFFPLNF